MQDPTLDPVLDRALRQVRVERTRDHRRRVRASTAVSTTLATAVLAGGFYLGQHSTPEAEDRPPGQRTSEERVLVGATEGVRMTATVTPVEGWLRLRSVVDGVPAGERCKLVVTDAGGQSFVAGGWVAAQRGETALAGAALVDLDHLRDISVVTADGRVLVTATP
ncbi:hypothetical protein [Saccharothrix coeruleofusca]|uniref:Anti-sigma factor n=1 Tax=Saccharothrix coeruleofusca TaxID=33919 RepID=A0A918EE81_9PSEU|nr:hypothetical protein [Saccharothrix coeruleofusca]MBP2337981.1 hypothetical protein [Saccharothrix coeruleofusca]GGP63505.1 hypothetical protein GCM10010185_40260 [Saccharothrix coeruleofusca]